MKFQQLALENFMSHRSLSLQWGGTSPLLLACGPNEIGKSALVQAMGFALHGECDRQESKGARKALITEGAKKGMVTLSLGDASITRNVADGKPAQALGDFAAEAGSPALWPFVLNHQAFSDLSADQRRVALFTALNVGTSASDITVLLAQKGHSGERITKVAPSIGVSMDAGVKFAKQRVSEARGAWQEVTGEAYGSVKAESWAPEAKEVPADAAEQIEALSAQREALARRREALVTERRQINEDNQAAVDRETKARDARNRITQLGCPVGIVPGDWLLELEAYIKLAAEAKGKAQAEAEAAGTALDALPVETEKPKTYGCPCCASALVLQGDALVAYVEGDLFSDPNVGAERTRLEGVLVAARDKVAAETRNIASAQAKIDAARPLVDVVNAHLAQLAVEDEEGLTSHARTVEQVTADIQAIDQEGGQIALKRNELTALVGAAEAAKAKAKRAGELHADLAAWQKLADDLEPSGIPAELLNKALKPLNDRLRASAQLTGWPQVQLGQDMAIYYGNRPYRLASESGRWRCDAMLTEAMLFLADVRAMVLDRFDVLDLASRSQFLRWMHGLAQRGEINSALLLGTLKEPPKLPATYNVVWLGEPVTQPGA